MELSKVSPDFESIVAQLTSELQTRDSWKDVLSSSTGQTLIEFMAACTSMLYYEIGRSVDELNIGTAKNLSSIYALAHLLGVPVRRAVGGEVKVTFTLPTAIPAPITFNKYDEFTVDGVPFFITQALTIPANTTSVTDITLRQGDVDIYEFESTGTPYQQFIVGSNYATDDKYVDVQVNNDPTFWTMTTDSIWQYGPEDQVFQVTAMPEGTIRLLFGDGYSGIVPLNRAPIKIYAVSTLGKAGNQSVSGLTVSPVIQPEYNGESVNISGVTTTPITGGDDQESIDRLRYTIPRFFASGKRAITRNDWTAIGLKYPQVADLKVWGEYEEGAQLLMMNTVKVCLLMNYGPATEADRNAFDLYISNYKALNTRVLYETAVPTRLSINISVYVKIGFSLVQVQSNVKAALEEFFKIQPGVIGKSIYVSDVNNVILSVPGVDYVEFSDSLRPTALSIVKNTAVPAGVTSPGTITATPFTTGGTLAAGTYYYKVTSVEANGVESAASPQVSAVTTGSTGRVDLSWTAVTGATSYRVYRGTSSNGQSLYFTTATNSYSDTNASSTAGTPSTGALTAATHYIVITALNGTRETGRSPELARVVPAANGSISVSWTAVAGATSYRVYVGTAAGAEDRYFTTTSNYLYHDGTGGTTGTPPAAGVIVNGTYYYVVVGVDAAGKEMAQSAEVSIVNSVTGTLNSNALSWTGFPEAVSYNVYRGTFTGGQNIQYTGILTTSYTDTGSTGVLASPPVIVPILKDPILLQRYNYVTLQPTPIVTTISSGR